MGVTNSNKVINADRIECDGSLKVTLALTGRRRILYRIPPILCWCWTGQAVWQGRRLPL